MVQRSAVEACDVLDAVDADRYDRQFHYFADQAAVSGPPRRCRWRRARDGGRRRGRPGLLDGLGSACAGAGRIVLVDDDTVELSNLNRQILYRTSDVGRLKVDAAADALGGFNPRTDIRPGARGSRARATSWRRHGTRSSPVRTADSPPHAIGRWVNEACLELGVPHISAGQFPPMVRVGPTFVPGRGACLECQERAIRRDFGLLDDFVEHRQRHAPVAATLGAARASSAR